MAVPNGDSTYYGDRTESVGDYNQSQSGLSADLWKEMEYKPPVVTQPVEKQSGTLDFSTNDIYGKCPKDTSSDPVDKLDDLKKFTDKNFDKIDKDGDGFMSEDELTEASKAECLSDQDKRAIEILQKNREDIEELSNDELGDENDGISKADMQKFDDLAGKYTEAEDMYRYMRKDIAKVDADGDGYVSKEELTKRIDSLDEKSDERKVLESMRDKYDDLIGQSNDEWGFDNTGISVDDTLDYAARGAIGFDETGTMMKVGGDLMDYWLQDMKKRANRPV